MSSRANSCIANMKLEQDVNRQPHGSRERGDGAHVQVHQKHMFVVATREERARVVVVSRSRGNRCARGGALSVNSVVKTQHGMVRSTIEFEERSSYPIGKFDELIQDRVDVRGTRFLIGKCSTKMFNRLGACRLNHPREAFVVVETAPHQKKQKINKETQ
jgi:hypothetical protein